MTHLSEYIENIIAPMCCMRKNPDPVQITHDYICQMVFALFVYTAAYFTKQHTLCLSAMTALHIIAFQTGIHFQSLYDANKKGVTELSLKQREQGASQSKCMTPEQNDKLDQQLKQVVEETRRRNLARMNTYIIRTPSNSTLEENDYDYIHNNIKNYPTDFTVTENNVSEVPTQTENYDDMPPLIPLDSGYYFSHNHYLHAYIDKEN